MKRIAIIGTVLLSGCITATRNDGPPRDTSSQSLPQTQASTPRPEPRSRYGNPPFYDQFGVRYHVLDNAQGYREQGIASWYGKKFHGKRTSSGETYDMYALSAAHKTLPIPAWVRVTNLDNQRSMILRVNDRGPFVDDRLIDLSYAAANALGIIKNGTGRVEVETIDFDSTGNMLERPVAPPPSAVAAAQQATSPMAAQRAPAADNLQPASAGMTLQTGAFSSFDNAERQLDKIVRDGINNAFIEHDDQKKLYRVRIDRIADSGAFDALVARLRSIGIRQARLVTAQ